jgi:hypothetical protein
MNSTFEVGNIFSTIVNTKYTNPILCITTSKSDAIETFATTIAAQLVQNTFTHPCFII